MAKTNTVDILKASGLKVTPARIALYDFLRDAQFPQTAHEAQEGTKKAGVDLVTIYRTLTSFEEKGLVRRVDLARESLSYELSDDHHHHIVCTDCNKVEDVTIVGDERLVADVLKKTKSFSSISRHSFELFGLCNTCARK